MAPVLQHGIADVKTWDDVKLLTVAINRLKRWTRPGLLCIGDAAHAMSPVGGVGINLAIQDAVAAANILGPKLAAGKLADRDLKALQRRREFPTRATQKVQVLVQNRIIHRVLTGGQSLGVPWQLKLMQRWPFLRRIPARIVGMGFRPEHIHTPEKVPTHLSELKPSA
jgi:2-polyprenyl-6-methoxyphenol hydroxylase-like FAD-dependent oxidoreductase